MKGTFYLLFLLPISYSCKKYPENTIWFKNPKHIPVINGYITEYKVNGIDSLDLLNAYYMPYVVGVSPPYPPFTNTQRDIRKEQFQACCQKYNYWQFNSDLYVLSDSHFSVKNKGKSITIDGSVDTRYFNKQLFLSSKGDINWDIQYLDKKGKKSKIKTTYNGNTYEITFEN